MPGSLGRVAPPDWKHIEKFPLTAAVAPKGPVPGVLGINWYSAFDSPVKDSRGFWWIGRDGNLGTVRGGHCIAAKPRGATDPTAWWSFYDQDDREFPSRIRSPFPWKEGGCTGFGTSRMLSQFNRRRYDPYFIYNEDQKIDEWPGEDYGGSSVRAALDVVRTQGARPIVRGRSADLSVKDGISANRWATSTEDFMAALGYADLDFIDLLNSWGRGYPHIVRLPASVLDRLRQEDGELGIPTDR